MIPFQSLRKYEHFVYTLSQQFPGIAQSTLVVIQRGRHLAELTGEILLVNRHRLVVYERLVWSTGPLTIEGYNYEAWHGSEKLFWYDSQPHPHDPALTSTDPHHKHIPPDIKRNRIPVPSLNFDEPNLPFLIAEIENLSA